MDDVRAAAAAKGEALGLGTAPPTRETRAVAGLLRRLDRPRDGMEDDLRVAVPVSRILARVFPGDPLLDPALDGALASIREELHGEQVAMANWAGRTGSARGQRILDRGMERVYELVALSDAAADRTERARLLRGSCRAFHRTRERIDLPPPRIDPPPFEGIAPEFALPDVNPASATFGRDVTPSSLRGRVTAWYFLRAT